MSEPNDKSSLQENPAPDGADEAVPSSSTERTGDDATGQVAQAQADAARFKEQWMRSAADFDNFRKRSRKELEDSRKAGREELLKDLLPVFDNLERAMTSAERATEVKPVSDGLKLVLRQFLDTLGRSGIQKVPTVGHPFDPSMHEAIQQVESDEAAPGTVMAEVQPGYLQGERLVRAAMVVVAKPRSESTEGGN
ncbi:MAG: Heat shock protein GrpE [Labilithrix sp.]|nr:Heat shock protein GrpE [Labilithrix sp.]